MQVAREELRWEESRGLLVLLTCGRNWHWVPKRVCGPDGLVLETSIQWGWGLILGTRIST